MDLKEKQVTVIGMAKSGLAAAKFLASRGAKVLVSDAKSKEKLAAEIEFLISHNIAYETGSHSQEALLMADLIVVSPGVPLEIAPLEQARKAGKKIIGEIELAANFLKGNVIGITGSNGKTTTTTLVGKVLSEANFNTLVGGNIGTPLISLVDNSNDDSITVVELSSFQLESTESLRLKVTSLLNITPNHLDRYASFDDYVTAKKRIFLNQQKDDFAVLNADDKIVSAMADITKARKIFFSCKKELEKGIFLRSDQIIYRDSQGQETLLLKVSEDVRLRGTHNLENVMVALAVGIALNAPIASMKNSISTFQGIEHRLEPVAEINGVNFVNDSKATSVDAAIKAVEAFPSNLILILGGKDKGSDYSPFRPLIAERVKHLILIGAATEKIAAALSGICPVERASTMSDAVEKGFTLAKSGDTVLLAPACSSYDMFDNFEQRGQVFKSEVINLQNKQIC
ncbi:MAG: UDP-N-acetylmuramoyl-L-alanine--D-glutamate ligase [Blastocatellia bacterium]|nr:UDP-N-acetylmuramoyl-L-alanine--D-glutamate ligase [Blastocatellia bacterium]